MVIQIDGTPSTNKGALLMLYSILKEIETSHPEAEVIINNDYTDLETVRGLFNLKISKRQSNLARKIIHKTRLVPITLRVCKPLYVWLGLKRPVKGVDLLIDAGGFQFGDEWNFNDLKNDVWERYLKGMHKAGTKIVFLPQAFGQFEKQQSKRIAENLGRYADVIVAREDTSRKNILSAGVPDEKVWLYPDFTSNVSGIESPLSEKAKGKVCIIPNQKIILHKVASEDDYITGMANIARFVSDKGFEVVLLNHEGTGDNILCEKIRQKSELPLDILYSGNALITKGIIASAYLVISSRFHGVANALNSGVPCLASSWSHKYQKLLADYGLHDAVIDLKETTDLYCKIEHLLNKDINDRTRKEILDAKHVIMDKNKEMWSKIWSLL